MSRWPEEDLRRLAFDYVRGELSMDESEAIQARMAESKSFEDYVKRLTTLMHGAKNAPPELHHSIDSNALFGRIADAIQAVEVEQEVVPRPLRRSRLTRGLLALAAAMVSAVLVWIVIAGQNEPQPEYVATVDVPTAQPEEPAREIQSVPFETLAAQVESVPGVRLFADDSADFSLEGEVDRRLEFKSGTLLVEYLPRKGERLSVLGNGFKVQVTGTVFYISDANDGVVGVITGSVLVVPDEGSPMAVRGGQEYLINEGIRAISPEQFEKATQHVTVEEHLDRLTLAHAQPMPKSAEVRPAKKTASKMIVSDQHDLRAEAQKAVRERRYDDASSLMEELLQHVPATDPIAGATRLDLARLYLQRLNQPQKAAFHLKLFVLARPSDAATPSAKAEFCRITAEAGRSDALCLP